MRLLSRTLSNGFEVFLVPMRSKEMLSAACMVKAGEKYAPRGSAEIPHFLEHMAFRGTRVRSQFDIAKTIDEMGGAMNAYTDRDVICYHVAVPAHYAMQALELLADVILHPLLRHKDIRTEKGPLLQESLLLAADPHAELISFILPALLNGEQPERRFLRAQDLKKITRSTLLSYMNSFFVGPNAALCLAGCIPDPNSLFALAEKLFGELPARPPKQRRLPKNEQKNVRIAVIPSKPREPVMVALGIKTYPPNHPTTWPLFVLNEILGGGDTSRLFTEIRTKRGLAYNASSEFEFWSDACSIVIDADLNRTRWQEGLQVLLTQLRVLRETKVSHEELTAAKATILAKIEMALEQPAFVTETLLSSWARWGRIVWFSEVKTSIRRVSPGKIQSAAKEVLIPSRISLAIRGVSKQNRGKILRMVSDILGS